MDNNNIQSPKIKIATLSVLLIAWLGICFEFSTILLNLSYKLPTQNGYCSMIIWLRYNWFILFELTLYIFWLIRIYHTFKFSVFEIRMKYTLIIGAICSFVCCIFIILTSVSMKPQYKEVNISLSSSLPHGFDCIPQWSVGGILTVYILGQITTLIFNLFFAFLFFWKLSKV